MLGYQGGVGAYLTGAATYNIDLDEMADAVWASAPSDAMYDAERMYDWTVKKRRSTFGLRKETYIACEFLKASWRAAHPATVALWTDVENGVRMAVAKPGEVVRVRQLAIRKDGAWLRIRLPSGRYLCYLQPEVRESGDITYMGVDQYTRQWKRIKTYGGKLVENIVQAWARDVLAYHMSTVEETGYAIVLTVHDELITETPDSDLYNADDLASEMTQPIPWAPGAPLAAAGFETYRYRKD
jgi:DNA polymerase